MNLQFTLKIGEYMVRVIIPAYKAQDTLPKALDSLVAQTKSMFLVTIVQDCDGEDYTEIIDKYIDEGLHITLIQNEENLGPGLSRQRAIDADTMCDYLMFLDADDMLLPNAVETLYMEAKRTDADMIISDFLAERAHQPLTLMKSESTPVTWFHGKIYKATYLRNNNIRFHPDLRLNEDAYFNLVAVNNSDKVGRISIPTYLWRDNPHSLTRDKDQPSFFDRSWKQYVLGQIAALLKLVELKGKVNTTVTALTLKNIYEHIMIALYYHFDINIPELKQLGNNEVLQTVFKSEEFWTVLQENLKTCQKIDASLVFYRQRFCDWFSEYVMEGFVQ